MSCEITKILELFNESIKDRSGFDLTCICNVYSTAIVNANIKDKSKIEKEINDKLNATISPPISKPMSINIENDDNMNSLDDLEPPSENDIVIDDQKLMTNCTMISDTCVEIFETDDNNNEEDNNTTTEESKDGEESVNESKQELKTTVINNKPRKQDDDKIMPPEVLENWITSNYDKLKKGDTRENIISYRLDNKLNNNDFFIKLGKYCTRYFNNKQQICFQINSKYVDKLAPKDIVTVEEPPLICYNTLYDFFQNTREMQEECYTISLKKNGFNNDFNNWLNNIFNSFDVNPKSKINTITAFINSKLRLSLFDIVTIGVNHDAWLTYANNLPFVNELYKLIDKEFTNSIKKKYKKFELTPMLFIVYMILTRKQQFTIKELISFKVLPFDYAISNHISDTTRTYFEFKNMEMYTICHKYCTDEHYYYLLTILFIKYNILVNKLQNNVYLYSDNTSNFANHELINDAVETLFFGVNDKILPKVSLSAILSTNPNYMKKIGLKESLIRKDTAIPEVIINQYHYKNANVVLEYLQQNTDINMDALDVVNNEISNCIKYCDGNEMDYLCYGNCKTSNNKLIKSYVDALTYKGNEGAIASGKFKHIAPMMLKATILNLIFKLDDQNEPDIDLVNYHKELHLSNVINEIKREYITNNHIFISTGEYAYSFTFILAMNNRTHAPEIYYYSNIDWTFLETSSIVVAITMKFNKCSENKTMQSNLCNLLKYYETQNTNNDIKHVKWLWIYVFKIIFNFTLHNISKVYVKDKVNKKLEK